MRLINEIRKAFFSKNIWKSEIKIHNGNLTIVCSLNQLKGEKFITLKMNQFGEGLNYNLNLDELVDFSNLLREAADELRSAARTNDETAK